ncbi:MAG: F0F1 ATP synthase subunit B, partial [Vulcanimicrobiaceae bacterium]
MEYAALHGIFWAKGTFWVTVAVLIFLGLAGKKIVAAIVKMLDDRSSEIRSQIDEATRLRAEAEAILKDADLRKNEALARAQDMLAAASRDAERLTAKLISEAHAVAKRREQMAKEQVAMARKAAIEEIQQQAASLAYRTAEIVLRQTIDAEQGDQLID